MLWIMDGPERGKDWRIANGPWLIVESRELFVINNKP